MKRYFAEGKEISKAEADEIIKRNIELSESKDFTKWLNIKFIAVLED